MKMPLNNTKVPSIHLSYIHIQLPYYAEMLLNIILILKIQLSLLFFIEILTSFYRIENFIEEFCLTLKNISRLFNVFPFVSIEYTN